MGVILLRASLLLFWRAQDYMVIKHYPWTKMPLPCFIGYVQYTVPYSQPTDPNLTRPGLCVRRWHNKLAQSDSQKRFPSEPLISDQSTCRKTFLAGWQPTTDKLIILTWDARMSLWAGLWLIEGKTHAWNKSNRESSCKSWVEMMKE